MALRRWAGTAIVIVLLVLAGRSLWGEAVRYQVRTVPEAQLSPALPIGSIVVVTRTPIAALSVGDVVDFRHPTLPMAPLFLRVGLIERAPGSSGYLVRLEPGQPGETPWYAELHGAIWRVVLSRDREAAARDLSLATWAAAGLTTTAALWGLRRSWRWYRHRPRGVARTYRPDVW